MGFTYETSMTPCPSCFWFTAIAIDASNGFLYAYDVKNNPFPQPDIGTVFKIDISTFSTVAALEIGAKDCHEDAVVVDTTNGYVYFGTLSGSVGYIEKIRLSDFSHVGTLTVGSGYIPVCLVLDTSGGYLYSASGNIPERKVFKVSLSSFSIDSSISLSGIPNHGAGVKIGDYLFFGCDIIGSYNGLISKVSVSSFTEVDTLTIANGGIIEGLAYDGTYLYAAYYSLPPYVSYVAKINLSSFTVVDTLTLSSPFDYSQTCFICNDFLYVGSQNCVFCQIRLSDFSIVTYIDKSSLFTMHQSSAYDLINKKGYFHAIYNYNYDYPGYILKFSIDCVASSYPPADPIDDNPDTLPDPGGDPQEITFRWETYKAIRSERD
jgi:hypothetical protein